MYQAILAVIQRALSAANTATLQNAARYLSQHIGRPVAASASSIMAAIRTYASNNPQKVMVLTTVLANAGIDIATEELKTVASHTPIMKRLVDEVVDAAARFADERASLTGDKNAATVHGIAASDVDRQVAMLKMTNNIIEKAVRTVGSLAALENIRAAVFLEEADFINYRTLKS